MTKPSGELSNELTGKPKDPNPGKGDYNNTESLHNQLERSLLRAVLDDTGPGAGLLNVMPGLPQVDPAVREQAYREMDLAWRQTRLTDYNRMAAEWGLPQVAQVSEQSYRTDAAGVRLSPQEAQAWQEHENRQRGQASVNGMPIRVTDDSVDALRGAYPDAFRAQEVARRLNRSLNEAVINGYSNPQPSPLFTSRREQYPNPELVMNQRRQELADLYIRHGSMVPPWVTVLNPMYRGVHLNNFTRDDWFTVLGQVALTLEQRPRPGALTETGRALLRTRQALVAHRCNEMGISVEQVLEPGREEYFNGTRLVELSDDVFRFMLTNMAGWARGQGLGNPHQPTLTEAGRALLHVRQDRVLRRCQQLGIPIEMVIEPGHEDHFNGRPIVEYSEGVFNQLLENMYEWVREQRSRAGVARHFSG